MPKNGSTAVKDEVAFDYQPVRSLCFDGSAANAQISPADFRQKQLNEICLQL